jgi:hypothetical protein
MRPTCKTVLFFLLINLPLGISAQEINVSGFRVDPRDISARENTVVDANGDACAIIKLRSGAQNLEFSTDMGIRKIENHDGEYWLWVPPNTSQITIQSEELGVLEYNLPVMTEEYIVYVLFLTILQPDKTKIRNADTLIVETDPPGAKFFMDKAFMGVTPLSIDIATDTFQYEIRKKKYIPVKDSFIYSKTQKEISIPLELGPDANRWYLMLTGTGGKPGIFGGIETGRVGKTGLYISFAPPVRTSKYIATIVGYNPSTLVMDADNFQSIVGESPSDYYLKIIPHNNTFYNNFRLKAGITQKVFSNTFLKVGLGFFEVTQYFKLNVIPYATDPLQEIPLDNIYYGKRGNMLVGAGLEAGFDMRFSGKYLVSLRLAATGIGGYYFSDDTTFQFLPLEYSLGVGYIFQ